MTYLYKTIRALLLCGIGAIMLQLTGCAQMSMSQPKPTIENAQKSRGIQNAAATMGDFVPEAAKPPSFDQGVSIRTNQLQSPVNGSFAQYLKETLRVELESAGLLDANSGNEISGTLIDSQVDAPIGTGSAQLQAQFVVTHQGKVRYTKILTADASWNSPFIGVEAVPAAAGQYEMLYRKLVGILLDDPEFRQAIKKS